MRSIIADHWSVLVGLLIGALLIPIIQTEYEAWRIDHDAARERGTPVVVATATIVERLPDAVLLRVTGTKLRDCRLVGVQAFSVTDGVMIATRMERTAPPLSITTPRPVGPFSMGVVRVWPVVAAADELALYALHTCGAGSVEVRSTLARVALHAPG